MHAKYVGRAAAGSFLQDNLSEARRTLWQAGAAAARNPELCHLLRAPVLGYMAGAAHTPSVWRGTHLRKKEGDALNPKPLNPFVSSGSIFKEI